MSDLLLEPSHTTPARRVDALEGSRILDLNQTHQWSIQLMAQGRVGGCIARYPAAFVARDQQQQGLPPIRQRLDPVPSSLELLSRVATKSD